MKYLIDTHILLWYMKGDNQLKKKHIELIDDPENEILISSASLWEIAIKVSIGKLELNAPFSDFIRYINENDFLVLHQDAEDLNELISLTFHHQDPFDRLIIAQSIVKKIPVISDDKKFSDYHIVLV